MKKKVIFLGKFPPPYIGPALACNLILNSSLKDEFDLIHLDMSDHRPIDTLAKFDFTNFYLAFKHYLMLVKLIIKHKPDLVYIPAGQTTVGYIRDSVFILISKILRRKVICHLRGGNFKNWYNSANRITKWWVRFVHKRVNGQIVLGNNLKHLFDWLIPDENIFVVPNGGNYIFPETKKEDDHVKVLFLGNFIYSKGVLDALKASVLLKRKQIKFYFAGNWNEENTKSKFKKILNEHKDLPVKNVGPVKGEEKFKLLASSDIFIFPTFYPNEGHPWVIIEAMAAGLPIISTDQGAITESVINDVNGFIVQKKNPEQIAEQISYLIDNPEIRKKMGEKSREFYLKSFTEEKMVENLSKAFNATIDFD